MQARPCPQRYARVRNAARGCARDLRGCGRRGLSRPHACDRHGHRRGVNRRDVNRASDEFLLNE